MKPNTGVLRQDTRCALDARWVDLTQLNLLLGITPRSRADFSSVIMSEAEPLGLFFVPFIRD